MAWQPNSLLITGGAGFIGSNFVHFSRAAYPTARLVVLDALTYAGNRDSLRALEHDPRMVFVHGDIRDRALVDSLLLTHAIDTVVHFAAESHVDRSIEGPDAFIETNIVGTHTLLAACRKAWLEGVGARHHRFHQVSTDEVYGSLEPDDPAFTETTPYAPNSPYAASKASADHLVRAYANTFGLSVTLTNCSNNYGPYQFPEKLIPLMIVRLLAGQPLPVYGDGRNVRDWLFVGDHCAGIDLVLRNAQPGATYNIGGGSELENINLVRRVCGIADEEFARDAALRARFPLCPAASGKPCISLLTYVKDRAGHDRRYGIDSRKIERELGYAARTEVSEGLRQTFRWYLDNEAWWRR